ncbi:hypothetical protein ACIA5G_44325 [Amycolatopsis sp. NPDC051758]|uniref:hypothetical protein n=1 Tax=Amycolatopsis sp. NPDC051758 TaxID=3363935 RepID=UPI0037A5FFEA
MIGVGRVGEYRAEAAAENAAEYPLIGGRNLFEEKKKTSSYPQSGDAVRPES